MPNTTIQQTSSPDITTVSNTLYTRLSWISWTVQQALSSDHLPIITTINIRPEYILQQSRRTFTNYKKANWTPFTEDTEIAFAQTTLTTNIHTANRIFKNLIMLADKHNIPKGKMHRNCKILLGHILCNITQRKSMRSANTCDPSLKHINEEITSDIHTQQIHRTSITTMPLCDHQIHNTSFLQLHPHTRHVRTPGFVDRPRRSDCTACQMDGKVGWWTTSGNIGRTPLARVKGVSRHQQQRGPWLPGDGRSGMSICVVHVVNAASKYIALILDYHKYSLGGLTIVLHRQECFQTDVEHLSLHWLVR